MQDDWLFRLGEKILEILPAIGGAFISLKYLPKEQRTPLGIMTAIVGGVCISIYGGHWVINNFTSLSKEPWSANFVKLLIAIFAMLILDKIARSIGEVKLIDVWNLFKQGLIKWLKP